MKINVFAKPGKKKEYVEQIDSMNYTVSVKEPAKDGRANQAVAKSLSEFFGIPRSQVNIISGQTSKQKVFEISGKIIIRPINPSQKKLF